MPLRDELIAAAEAGDFCELSSVDGVRASIVIQGSDSPTDKSGSPLARQLAGAAVTDEARCYQLVLPHVERVIALTDEYEPLWRDSWKRIQTALDSFAKGESTVAEVPDIQLSVVMLARAVFGSGGFDPSRHAAPFTAISHHARGKLFLIATPLTSGWAYRIDYPYYSWAETIVRPRVKRRDFTTLIAELKHNEHSDCGEWRIDSSELASAIKFSDQHGMLAASKLTPDAVAKSLRLALSERVSADAQNA